MRPILKNIELQLENLIINVILKHRPILLPDSRQFHMRKLYDTVIYTVQTIRYKLETSQNFHEYRPITLTNMRITTI